jgi:GNAT superfamily N-acetyltransferase
MKPDLTIRSYREGDEAGVFQLQQAVYPQSKYDRDKWLRRWRWLYRDNPAGNAVIYLAEAGGRIVGQYAVVPVRMKIGGERAVSAISLDTMTHPDYRGRGIFQELSRRVFDDAGQRGIDTIYGMPNKMTSWHRKYWLEVGAQRLLIRPLNIRNILTRYINNRFLLKASTSSLRVMGRLFYNAGRAPEVAGLTVTRASSFDERINDLWERASNDYGIMVIRDKEYLNWRYVDLPDVDYEVYVAEKEGRVLGYTVLKCEERQGLLFGRIHDLFVPSGQEPVVRSLVLKAGEFFEQAKADLVIYRLTANKKRYETVRKCGFISPRFISNEMQVVTRPNTPGFAEAFLRDRGNWFVQTGDFDPA